MLKESISDGIALIAAAQAANAQYFGTNQNASASATALNNAVLPTVQASHAGFDFSAIWMIAAGQMPTLLHAP